MIRTHDGPNNLCIALFLHSILGPDYYVYTPVIALTGDGGGGVLNFTDGRCRLTIDPRWGRAGGGYGKLDEERASQFHPPLQGRGYKRH